MALCHLFLSIRSAEMLGPRIKTLMLLPTFRLMRAVTKLREAQLIDSSARLLAFEVRQEGRLRWSPAQEEVRSQSCSDSRWARGSLREVVCLSPPGLVWSAW